MILLTRDEVTKAVKGKRGVTYYPGYTYPSDEALIQAQNKKTLINVGKEVKRMDGTTYLVPDYHKYREALKEVGLK